MIRASGKEWLSHINVAETFWILAKTYADCISTIHAVDLGAVLNRFPSDFTQVMNELKISKIYFIP